MAQRDMNAFVANTDRDWFDFLAARHDVDEVAGSRARAAAGSGRWVAESRSCSS
jgi:hypothetical protein